MTKWKYVGGDERDYPFSVGTVQPGDSVEADENPDPLRFKQARRPAAADAEEKE